MSYFIEGINYTLSNEDTFIEYDILSENAENVFCIGGSGSRVLPLLAKNPKNIHIVDISLNQLFLVELRVQAAKQLEYEEFLFFMGYRGAIQDAVPLENSRYDLFQKLSLSSDCKAFWESNKQVWISKGPILIGSWEAHFQKLNKIFKNILKFNMFDIFNAQNISEQRELYNKHFKHRLFNLFSRVFLNEYVFNKFLYKGHFSGTKENKTDDRPLWKFFEDNFRRIFTETLVRKNYFFQMLFLGRIYFEEALPLEAHRKIIDKIKQSNSNIIYKGCDLQDGLKLNKWDFISLSDTLSYLPNEYSENILQYISPFMNNNSKIVIRSFLKNPNIKNIDETTQEKELEKWAFNQDSSSIYKFNIYSFNNL